MSIKESDIQELLDGPAIRPAATANTVRSLLRRLKRLVTIQQRCSELLNTQGMCLVKAAIFSTYCDCRSLGVGPEAMEVIHAFPRSSSGAQEQAAPRPA